MDQQVIGGFHSVDGNGDEDYSEVKELQEEDSEPGDHVDVEAVPFLRHGLDSADQGANRGIGRRRGWNAIMIAASLFIGVNLVVFSVILFSKVTATARTSQLLAVNMTDHHPSTPQHRPSSEYILSPAHLRNAPPSVREYHWTISDAMFNPDGIHRPMLLINNQFPGPLIECNEGDTIVVNIHNEAENATAIHFHGMYQNGTNSMDGTVGVTQCPVAHDTTFTYRFTVSGQSGTYWYHGHHSAQAIDGLVGPMVVHPRGGDAPDVLPYASDRVVMIQDHYHNASAALLMDYLRPDQENEEPVPSSGLINGRNYRPCEDFTGWDCSHQAGRLESLETLALERHQNHRLRFINTGAFAEFQVEVDEHPLYITEADGTTVHPHAVDRLNIAPAQRYSIVLTTNATSGDAFWLRGRMVTHCFRKENPWLDSEVKAIVRYDGKPGHSSKKVLTEPQTKAWSDQQDVACRDLNATALTPLEAQAAPPATSSVFLRANFEIGAWRLSRGFFNSSSWIGNATSPTLYRLLDAAGDSDLFNPQREFVHRTSGIETVDIVISNFDDGAHPFHLHGHTFFVLMDSATGYPPEDLEAELHRRGRLENPLRRDTVTVQGYGWAAVRVVLDNPGVWAFHCHNAWHAEAGMMMVFAARTDDMAAWDRGESGRGLCRAEGVERGMRPSDDVWAGNFGD